MAQAGLYAGYKHGEITRPLIREMIANLDRSFKHELGDEEQEAIARTIEAKLDISMDLGARLITPETFRPWLPAARAEIEPYYWDRYKDHLELEGYPRGVVGAMDEVTDAVLGFLGNPEWEGNWDRRGLVLGHVQSGKTANYIGLVCKACDAGYKVIIVLAGLQNTLRRQTQERIDEGFLGFDPGVTLDQGSKIGVGRIDDNRRPNYLTTAKRDFNRNSREANGIQWGGLPEPVVLVIKKNKNILENLISLLRQNAGNQQQLPLPALIIDDEADNASINVGKHDNISRINGLLRELLSLFSKSSYVGYTATPFANVFIDPRSIRDDIGADLFPRDFIYSLDPPTNYMGANEIFGDDSDLNIIQLIEDNDSWLPVKHKNEIAAALFGIPESLKEAIRTFVLARAIRILSGDDREHSSMMVNASRFNIIQGAIRQHIKEYVDELKPAVRFEHQKGTDAALKNDHIHSLFDTWKNQEFDQIVEDWQQIQEKLWEAVSPIDVVEVNMRSKQSLDYKLHKENGLHVIAVGGISLSRGLTLEGLLVSYFLRNSMMYDTVMQMGRWFGYRDGYERLCRIWLREESLEWYQCITESIEELREDLRSMQSQNIPPRDFGMKVLMHDDVPLIATARNKMGTGERIPFRPDFSKKLVETSVLSALPEDIDANHRALERFVSDLGGESAVVKYPKQRYFWRCDVEIVISFLQKYRNATISRLSDPDKIVNHIRDTLEDINSSEELKEWDVVLVSLQKAKIKADVNGLTVNCADRTAGKEDGNFDLNRVIPVSGVKRRVGEPRDLTIGLTDTQIKAEDEKYKNQKRKTGRYLFKGRKPLLIVRLVRMTAKSGKDEADKEIPGPEPKGLVAWGILFPESERVSPAREYMVSWDWRDIYLDRDEDYDEDIDIDVDSEERV